jgi:hypothetical protein
MKLLIAQVSPTFSTSTLQDCPASAVRFCLLRLDSQLSRYGDHQGCVDKPSGSLRHNARIPVRCARNALFTVLN